jgi:hypothetical protein
VGNLLLRGGGSYDLLAIKKGLRAPELKLSYVVPSAAPIDLLQWVKTDLNKSLSAQVIYWKGSFADATDIISLLYKGLRIAKATVFCDVEDVVRASLDFVGQDLVTGAGKIANATYTDYEGAIAFNENLC